MTDNVNTLTLSALQSNDRRAWATLYDWLAGDLRSFIRRQGAHDVDDVLGETMLQLVRDIHSFAGDVSEIRPWAFRVSRNRVIDASRRQKRRPVHMPLDDDSAQISISVDHAGEFDLDSLSRALDILTPDQREVLWLRYALDLSLDDTARIVETSPDAVASMAHRALSRLRKASPGA